MRDNGFARAQAEYEARLPPEYDDNECPECGSSITNDHGDWSCDNDECDWIAQEPDCPDYEEG
jgi:hypothetical protein